MRKAILIVVGIICLMGIMGGCGRAKTPYKRAKYERQQRLDSLRYADPDEYDAEIKGVTKEEIRERKNRWLDSMAKEGKYLEVYDADSTYDTIINHVPIRYIKHE